MIVMSALYLFLVIWDAFFAISKWNEDKWSSIFHALCACVWIVLFGAYADLF